MEAELELLLEPAVVSRLKAHWAEDYAVWNRRDLSGERYVYVWADGIYSTLRGEDDRLCLLVLIGVDELGEKRLLALSDGYRESMVSPGIPCWAWSSSWH